LLVAGAVVGGALLIDGAWAATSAVRGLSDVRYQLELGVEDLMAGRLPDAEARFGLARSHADGAAGITRHPAAALADVLPVIGDDIDAIQTMGQGVARVADAASVLVDAAQAAGWDGTSLPGSEEPGTVPLEPIRAAAPHLSRAATQMGEAKGILDGIDAAALLGPVGDAATTVREAVTRRASALRATARVAEILPGFLGGDEPRRYFVALQNLSAPRGTGGFLGLYGILAADNGSISLETFEHVARLGTVPPIRAPEDVEARYSRFGGTTHFIAANYSPDFPTSAGVILEMWRRSGAPPLDGVIAADPVLMSYLLNAYGPVSTPAWPEPLIPQNVSTVLHRDTFTLPKAESDIAQEGIGEAFWAAVVDNPLPIGGLIDPLTRAVRERHLQVFSVDPEEQDALLELGAAGQVDLTPNPLYVVWQDATAARAGFFARKEAVHRVSLAADGSATVETEVILENGAPDGPPSPLLGEGATGDPVGYFAAFVSVYLPRGAAGVETSVEPGVPLGIVEKEFGHPVAVELLGAPPGERATMTVRYEAPGAVVRRGGVWEYRLGYLPQSALTPSGLEVEIAVPPGAEVVDASPGLRASGPTLRFQGSPATPTGIWVRFRLPS
jgi:hypothetical protein